MAGLSLPFTLEMAALTSDSKINGGSVCALSLKPLDFSRLSATLLLICPLGHEGVVKKKALEQPADP